MEADLRRHLNREILNFKVSIKLRNKLQFIRRILNNYKSNS